MTTSIWMWNSIRLSRCRTSSSKVRVSPFLGREAALGISNISVTIRWSQRKTKMMFCFLMASTAPHSINAFDNVFENFNHSVQRASSFVVVNFHFSFSFSCTLCCYQSPSWWTAPTVFETFNKTSNVVFTTAYRSWIPWYWSPREIFIHSFSDRATVLAFIRFIVSISRFVSSLFMPILFVIKSLNKESCWLK